MKTTEAATQFCEDFIEAMNSRKQQKSSVPVNVGFLTRGAINLLTKEVDALNRLRSYLDVVIMPVDCRGCPASLSTLITVIVDSYSRPVSVDEIVGRLRLLRFTWAGGDGLTNWVHHEHADFIRDYLSVERPVKMAGGRVKVLRKVGLNHWTAVRPETDRPTKPSTKKLARVTTGKRATARRTRPMFG